MELDIDGESEEERVEEAPHNPSVQNSQRAPPSTLHDQAPAPLDPNSPFTEEHDPLEESKNADAFMEDDLDEEDLYAHTLPTKKPHTPDTAETMEDRVPARQPAPTTTKQTPKLTKSRMPVRSAITPPPHISTTKNMLRTRTARRIHRCHRKRSRTWPAD